MSPDEYCQQKAAKSGSSFYYSFMFLPPQKRRAITALYAFCREVDDIVDECSDISLAATKLSWWRSEIALMAEQKATHPVTQAMAPFQQSMGITAARLNEVIDGMQMDLEQTRYLDFTQLKLYCHRVAGVVGLMACDIFGRQSESTLAYAEKLGLALQLTNIIRDVGEDARNGRVYLPIEDLQRFNVPVHQILRCETSPAFMQLMEFQAQRAREAYRQAYALLPESDRKAQRTGLIMGAIYSLLLTEIESNGFKVLSERTSLTPLRKLWVAYRTWSRAAPVPV
jgi:15-cis-phytoene synthase